MSLPSTDFFTFYNLPIRFHPDEAVIKKKFYALSKQYHPDFYANESQEKQDEVMELSTLNNKAYKVLSDPLKRIEYVLDLNGMLAEGDKYTLPQDFLMDMMDINEALMDMEFEPDAARLIEITAEVDSFEASLFDRLKSLTEEFDQQADEENTGILTEIKDIWYRQKYLQRLRTSMAKFKG